MQNQKDKIREANKRRWHTISQICRANGLMPSKINAEKLGLILPENVKKIGGEIK